MGFYKFLKEYQGFLFIHVFFYMYQYSFMVLNCQPQGRHINLIVPNLSCVQGSTCIFFTDSSEQLCEEDTYFCFSGQKAEVQRGSVIGLRSHSS